MTRLDEIDENVAAHQEYREGPYADDARTTVADLSALLDLAKAVRALADRPDRDGPFTAEEYTRRLRVALKKLEES